MSPCVFMIRSSTAPSTPSSSGNVAWSFSRVSYACASASGEPRVPMRTSGCVALIDTRIGESAATSAARSPSAIAENRISQGLNGASGVVELAGWKAAGLSMLLHALAAFPWQVGLF